MKSLIIGVVIGILIIFMIFIKLMVEIFCGKFTIKNLLKIWTIIKDE